MSAGVFVGVVVGLIAVILILCSAANSTADCDTQNEMVSRKSIGFGMSPT